MTHSSRSYGRISRREFIALLGLGGGAVAASPLRFLIDGHIAFSLFVDPQNSSFPVGRRPIHLRALFDNTAWTAPNHVAQDFVGWIQDLRPDTLVRFFSGPQNGSMELGQVSGYPNPNETMTVLEFLQNCLSACANVNSTTLFPRLNMNMYKSGGMSPLVQAAQGVWSIVSNLNPPQTLLSLDNWDDNEFTDWEATNIINSLRNLGFQGFACGPNAAQGIPNGLATFALFDEGDKPLSHFQATVSQQPSIMMAFQQTDFPGPLETFAQSTPDVQAEEITSFFQSQGQVGSVPFYYAPYIYWSDINTPEQADFAYDITQIFTSSSGAYDGKSLYEVTKESMNQYNAITIAPLFTSSSSSSTPSSSSTSSSSSSTVSETALTLQPETPFVIPWLGGYELALSVSGGLVILALRRRTRRRKQSVPSDLTGLKNSE